MTVKLTPVFILIYAIPFRCLRKYYQHSFEPPPQKKSIKKNQRFVGIAEPYCTRSNFVYAKYYPFACFLFWWQTGAQNQESKFLCCLCCRSGPISGTVNVNRSGFVPGEAIHFNAEIQNMTSRVCGCYVKLNMVSKEVLAVTIKQPQLFWNKN